MSPKEFLQKTALIKAKIESANRILVTIHRSPDSDSLGCALAMADSLKILGKTVSVVCPDHLSSQFAKLPGIQSVQQVSYPEFPFHDFDLLILLDTPPEQFSVLGQEVPPPDIPTVIIDHHDGSLPLTIPEKILVVDIAACAQLVFRFLQAAHYPISPTAATLLLAGIRGDTNGLTTKQTDEELFKVIADLVRLGASWPKVTSMLDNNLTLEEINLLGIFAQKLKLDEQGFVWSAIDYPTHQRFGCPSGFTSLAANLFLLRAIDSQFGFALIEKEPGLCQLSWRSLGSLDVSLVAKALGGGGHRDAAAVRIKGKFRDVVQQALEKSREFARLQQT